MKLTQFLSDLGSKKGAPGGGAAAAVTGALGAALVEMTGRLNDARVQSSSGAAKKSEALRIQLHSLIARDARAFLHIQKIYKIRKSKPAQWQAALRNGAAVPLKICQICADAAVLAKKEKSRTSAWLESDRLEALILLGAAFRAAELNVEINLKEMWDVRLIKKHRDALKKWRKKL